uniref:EF-hand domain-containing protein n=1 Tax=Amphimedon queenslandica TaxID=400682 RepID=A0A1X7UDT0_AMPQE
MFEEEEEPSETSKEEEIYVLLFKQCDEKSNGWVTVDKLVSTIQSMLHSSPRKGEDVYDSEQSGHEAQYNLELLKCMLDNHSINGEINEKTYIHVIRHWVKDLRGRSESPCYKSPNVSGTSFKEEDSSYQDGVATALFQESFETTGGGSSHQELDEMQLINELRTEKKKLQDRNQTLSQQIQQSEETTLQLMNDNSEMLKNIKSQQQSIAALEKVKERHEELLSRWIDEEKSNEETKQNLETLYSQVHTLNSEVAHWQNEAVSSQEEKERVMSEYVSLKQTLSQKDELIAKLETNNFLLQSNVEEQTRETMGLRQALSLTKETVEDLQVENSSLHSQLKEPISSTPFRPQAPSLRDELAENGIYSGLSPVSYINTTSSDTSMEVSEDRGNIDIITESKSTFGDRISQSKEKFAQKASLMKRQLSDLIDAPLTTSIGAESRTGRDSFTSNKENEEVFEAKLKRLATEKKSKKQRSQKLEKELRNLRKENEILKERCDQLQTEVKNKVPVVDEYVKGQSSDVHLLLTSAPPEGAAATNSQNGAKPCTSPEDKESVAVSVQTDVKSSDSPNHTSFMEATPTYTASDYESLQAEVLKLRNELEIARESLKLHVPLKGKMERPLEEGPGVHTLEQQQQRQEEEPTPAGAMERGQVLLSATPPFVTSFEGDQALENEQLLTSAQEETRLESILYQRRSVTPMKEVNEDVAGDTSRSQFLSNVCMFTLKTLLWLLLCTVLLILLFLALVEFKSSLGRCSIGQACSRSPLRMILGQYIQYTHTGEVPV